MVVKVATKHTVTYSALIDYIVIVLKVALYSSGYANTQSSSYFENNMKPVR
jgi:hypothetical protein